MKTRTKTERAILPWEELREVVASKDSGDLFVAAQALPDDDVLVLVRGDLRSLVVPLSTFRQAKGGPKPDAARVSVTDYGQTVRLGEYEIAADALLYEFDADARRRLKKRAIQADATLGVATTKRLDEKTMKTKTERKSQAQRFKAGHVYSIDVERERIVHGKHLHVETQPLLRGSFEVHQALRAKDDTVILFGELIENGERYLVRIGKGFPR